MEPISIIVVDDHPLFRQGVVSTLSVEPDFKVVGEAGDGELALKMLRTLQPNIAVLDVNLPGMNGQQILRQVQAEKLPISVILLTAYDDIEQQQHALRGGAAAFCTKEVRPEDLVRLIRKIALADPFTRPDGNAHKIIELNKQSGLNWDGNLPDEPEAAVPLSEREMEVLSQLTKGYSNKEIACLLGISHQTVKNHVTSILRKIGVEDRTQAAVYALRRGWVRLFKQDEERGI